MKILMADGWGTGLTAATHTLFANMGHEVLGVCSVSHADVNKAGLIEEADVIVFTGGADVNPKLYGQQCGPRTHFDYRRDLHELAVFALAKQLKKPMVGICRGMQFLWVMSGGQLHQHIDGHAGSSHIMIVSKTEEAIKINSLHHQCINFASDEVNDAPELLAYAGKDVEEAMYLPEINALCVQYHPEFMDFKSQGTQQFVSWFNEYIHSEYIDQDMIGDSGC